MAWQTVDLLDTMKKDADLTVPALRVDGGACANDLLMQLQSDFAALPIERPACIETTALGAANLAGLGVGVFRDPDDIRACVAVERTFTPALPAAERDRRLTEWHRAVGRSLKWAEQA
jgi:glycerol kinase